MKKIKFKRTCRGGGKPFVKGKEYSIPKDISKDLALQFLKVPDTAEPV